MIVLSVSTTLNDFMLLNVPVDKLESERKSYFLFAIII